MKLSEQGETLLHAREISRSPNLTAYKDTVGVWTIAYGNTFYANGTPVKAGDKITKADADKLFKDILSQFEDKVKKLIDITKLNQNQYDALISLVYNIGTGAFGTSTLRKLINDGKHIEATIEFLRWRFPNEIISRRLAEARQFAGVAFTARYGA